MSFQNIFFHAIVKKSSSNKPLHSVTSKVVETKLEEIITDMACKPISVKLMPDHFHVLFAMPTEGSPDLVIQELKDVTSALVKGMGRDESIEWERDYGIVSVSESHIDILKKYIDTQEERHRTNKLNDTLERIS